MEGQLLLPSELERQQMFHRLKRVSSVTAWRRILDYYRDWITVMGDAVRIAEQQGPGFATSIHSSEYPSHAKYLALFEGWVAELASGNKRMFERSSVSGFPRLGESFGHWSRMPDRFTIGENGVAAQTPLWPEFCDTLNSFLQAWVECTFDLLTPYQNERMAAVQFDLPLRQRLASMPHPPALAPVLEPADNILVWSGQSVPCAGIWEPVEGPKPSLIGKVFRSPGVWPPYVIAGPMNYLHALTAPSLRLFSTSGDHIETDTTWRLLWRDDRYLDGTVPAEESLYRFEKPDAVLPPPPPVYMRGARNSQDLTDTSC